MGGPDQYDNYEDARDNFRTNEVACDYNAGFQSAVAGTTNRSVKNEKYNGQYNASISTCHHHRRRRRRCRRNHLLFNFPGLLHFAVNGNLPAAPTPAC